MHGSVCRRSSTAILLTALLVLQAPAVAWGCTTRHGHVGAADRALLSGCHRYRYHYVVKPPTRDWILETWLHDPRGKPRRSGDFVPGSDPRRGHGHFGICRSTEVPGRFTITARLTWYTPGMLPTDLPVEHQRWLEPAHFRLHR